MWPFSRWKGGLFTRGKVTLFPVERWSFYLWKGDSCACGKASPSTCGQASSLKHLLHLLRHHLLVSPLVSNSPAIPVVYSPPRSNRRHSPSHALPRTPSSSSLSSPSLSSSSAAEPRHRTFLAK